MTDLGTASPADTSVAVAINDKTQVLVRYGTSFAATSLWTAGKSTDLGSLGGTSTAGLAVNGNGSVVGRATTPSGQTHAFVWKSGQITDLGTLGGVSSGAGAINDRNQIIGSSTTANRTSRGALAVMYRDGPRQ